MNIAILHGQWAQNIGNAFFNLGGEYVINKAAPPNSKVFKIMDQPNYRTLHNKFNGNPKNYWDPIINFDLDLVILQGPVLNSWLEISWGKTIRRIIQNGGEYALHSCSFFKFTESEIQSVKEFLTAMPPKFISTRDSHAHDIIKSWNIPIPLIDGIDAGFFVNAAYTPPPRGAGEGWLAFNFDRYPEPTLKLQENGKIQISNNFYSSHLDAKLHKRAARGKITAYVSELFDTRILPTELEGLKVVRPEHRFFPHITRKIYKRPWAFASDEPYTYLACYSGAALTLSDRVHACVAALSYGNEAMLYTPSPRAALFERVGAINITTEPQSIDPKFLASLQEEHIIKIRSIIS